MKHLALVLLAACAGVGDEGGPWQPAAAIDGALAMEHGPPPATPGTPGPTLRVATWNVHFAAAPEVLASSVLASLELARADVLLVQEIEASPGEASTRTARLATALGMTWVYAPARVEGDGTHGLAILARYPLEDVAVRALPYMEQPLHPRDRIALAADVVIGTTRVRLVNVHLDVRIGAADRVRQLHPAVNDLPAAFVVGGDFNTNPWAWFENLVPLAPAEAIAGQEQAAVIDDYLVGKGLAPAVPVDAATMRLPAFQIRTDNLYVRGHRLFAAGVEHVEGSDHWPVWMEIAR